MHRTVLPDKQQAHAGEDQSGRAQFSDTSCFPYLCSCSDSSSSRARHPACCQPLLSSYFPFSLAQLTGHSLAPTLPSCKNLHKSPVPFAPDHLPGLCVQLGCLDLRHITSERALFSPLSHLSPAPLTSQTPSRALCIVRQLQSPPALNPWHQTKSVI